MAQTLDEWYQTFIKSGAPYRSGDHSRPPFRIPNKVRRSTPNPQLDSRLLRLPLDVFMLLFNSLDQYDQIVLLFTCKFLLRLGVRLNFKYNNPKDTKHVPSELCRLNPDLLRTSHSPIGLASLLVRIAPRCLQHDFSESSWRPCISCLRYKRTLPQIWRKTSFKPPYPKCDPFSTECIENAISVWCDKKTNKCPTCAVRSFTRLGWQIEEGRLPYKFMVCRACSWCKKEGIRQMPEKYRAHYDGRPIKR